jgi:hypothetical protein
MSFANTGQGNARLNVKREWRRVRDPQVKEAHPNTLTVVTPRDLGLSRKAAKLLGFYKHEKNGANGPYTKIESGTRSKDDLISLGELLISLGRRMADDPEMTNGRVILGIKETSAKAKAQYPQIPDYSLEINGFYLKRLADTGELTADYTDEEVKTYQAKRSAFTQKKTTEEDVY